jgi:hypothetical protein
MKNHDYTTYVENLAQLKNNEDKTFVLTICQTYRVKKGQQES